MKTLKNLVTGTLLVLVLLPLACQTIPKHEGSIFTIRVRHISDYKAYEDHRVGVNEPFYLADTEYQAEVKRFVPDFAINLKTKEVISRSDKPLNPAVKLAVSFQNQLLYETWSLYQNPLPHAVHDPGYYFQLINYEIPDRPVER